MDLTLDILLSKRDYDFYSLTKKVLSVIGENLTKAAHMYLSSDRDITWYKIDKVTGLDNYVFIFGNVELRSGDIIDTSEGQVIVTEESRHKYKNTLKLVAHLDVLQNKTVAEIHSHLQYIKTLASQVNEFELIELLKHVPINEDMLLNTPVFDAILEQITKPRVLDSFNLEALNDDQIASFRLCTNLARGKMQ